MVKIFLKGGRFTPGLDQHRREIILQTISHASTKRRTPVLTRYSPANPCTTTPSIYGLYLRDRKLQTRCCSGRRPLQRSSEREREREEAIKGMSVPIIPNFFSYRRNQGRRIGNRNRNSPMHRGVIGSTNSGNGISVRPAAAPSTERFFLVQERNVEGWFRHSNGWTVVVVGVHVQRSC